MQHVAPASLIDSFMQRRQAFGELRRAVSQVLLKPIHAEPARHHPPDSLKHLLGKREFAAVGQILRQNPILHGIFEMPELGLGDGTVRLGPTGSQ